MSTCESCGRTAQVTTAELAVVDFIEPYDEISESFQLCLRCVPVEQRPVVDALPGLEDDVDLELALLELHRPPVPAAALAGAGR